MVEKHIDHLFDTIYYQIFFERDEIKKFLTEQKLKIDVSAHLNSTFFTQIIPPLSADEKS